MYQENAQIMSDEEKKMVDAKVWVPPSQLERLAKELEKVKQSVNVSMFFKMSRDLLIAQNDLTAANERLARLEEALKQMARQLTTAQMTDHEHETADFEGAYDMLVHQARAALASTNNGRASEGKTT